MSLLDLVIFILTLKYCLGARFEVPAGDAPLQHFSSSVSFFFKGISTRLCYFIE
jgi:hypothetical protein